MVRRIVDKAQTMLRMKLKKQKKKKERLSMKTKVGMDT